MDNLQTIRILIVDDDEGDYEITREILRGIVNQKYELHWAPSYKAALEEIRKDAYDVFLVDYNLGAKTGLDLMDESIDMCRNTPVILLTGLDDRSVDLMAMKKGVSDFLRKGKIDEELLERSIRYAIEKKRTENQILYLAYYDQVTSLPNRVFFKEQLNYALAHAIRYGRSLAILFLDLDNFKLINDSLGHHIGDHLLKEVAKRLYSSIRKSDIIARNELKTLIDTVARLGGDEFTISLTEINSYENASMVANRIMETLNAPFLVDGHEIFVGASIGISLYPHDADDADTLLKYADNAMYYAKKLGKNCFQYYQKSMNDSVIDNMNTINSLRKAIEKSEFALYYQPKMEVATGRLIGLESLIRWNRADRGLLLPADFIPAAERFNLMSFITEWVVREACRQCAEWKSAKLPALPVSINVPVAYFRKPDFTGTMRASVESFGLLPESIEIELTESIFTDDMKATVEKIEELESCGFRISIDDFGTGFSSLSRLRQVPCHMLKIDRSFIASLGESEADANIVRLVISMGHGMKMAVCAEGVETDSQFDFISQCGCDCMQGFILSRPKPAGEVNAILEAEAAGRGIGVELLERLHSAR